MAIVERLREFGKSDPADDTWAAMDVMHEAADLITELVAALEPFARFAEMLERQPIHGNGGILYALHMGTEDQAVLREIDCFVARVALARARSKGE